MTVSDKKFGVDEGSDGDYDYYTADVVNANDYYPGGMLQPNRTYSADESYRYGFNGKESDNEVKGAGAQYDYGDRIYDSRIGRWHSTDRIEKPWLSPYQFASGNPVNLIDPDGGDEIHFHFVTVNATVTISKWDSEKGGNVPVTQTIVRTYTYATIIKDNNVDRFFVHRQNKGKPETIEFYPNTAPQTRSGVTQSSWWLWSDTDDTDLTSLEKLSEKVPGLREAVLPETMQSPEQGSRPTAQNQNRKWWNNFYDKLDYRKQKAAEQEQVNNLMLGVLVGAAAELFVARIIAAVSSSTTIAVETRVLGSFPKYLEVAEKIGAKRFSMPTEIWNAMSAEERWAANVKFLDRGIANGDNFVLSNSAFEAVEGTSFYKELQYMYSRGYKASADGMSLIKK